MAEVLVLSGGICRGQKASAYRQQYASGTRKVEPAGELPVSVAADAEVSVKLEATSLAPTSEVEGYDPSVVEALV